MRHASRWLTGLWLVSGCASPPAPVAIPDPAPLVLAAPGPAAPSLTLLTEADWLLEAGHYAEAMRAYSEFLQQFPQDTAAARVRATRGALAALVATSAEVARLRDQTEAAERDLARLRRDLSGRQTELGRLREELAERRAQLGRLSEEADNLRSDLERLKSVDFRLERPR